jgi:cytochrome c oxidase subunit 4
MSHETKQDAHVAHAHPSGATYLKVGVILTLITAIEVWAYYVPALVAHPLFNPALIFFSALKFGIVVLFYMHLKYDHRLFKVLFTGPLIIAMATITALLFLFKHFAL